MDNEQMDENVTVSKADDTEVNTPIGETNVVVDDESVKETEIAEQIENSENEDAGVESGVKSETESEGESTGEQEEETKSESTVESHVESDVETKEEDEVEANVEFDVESKLENEEKSESDSKVESDFKEMSKEYDVELNSIDYNFVLGYDTPAKVKNSFVRKVLFIFLIQMFTSFLCATAMFLFDSRPFLTKYRALGYIAYFLFAIGGSLVAMKPSVIRNKVVAWFFIPIGTALFSVMIASLASSLNILEVLFVHLIFNGLFVVALVFTAQNKVPLTGIYGDVTMLIFTGLAYGISGIFIKTRVRQYVYSVVAGVIIEFYILVVLRSVVNGRKLYKYSTKDYVLVPVLFYFEWMMRGVNNLRYVFSSNDRRSVYEY